MSNVTIYYSKEYHEYTFVFNDTKKKINKTCMYACLCITFSQKQKMVYSEHTICQKGRYLGTKIDISEAPDEIIQFWNDYKKGEDKL